MLEIFSILKFKLYKLLNMTRRLILFDIKYDIIY